MGASESRAAPLTRFAHLTHRADPGLFARAPKPLRDPAAVASGMALGAVLYAPATTPNAGLRLLDGTWPSVTAMVFCLEDAIADRDLADAEMCVFALLQDLRRRTELAGGRDARPFVFVRVRSADHLERLLGEWGELADELDGIVIPKVGADRFGPSLRLIESASVGRDSPLLAMPILEGTDVAHVETRIEALTEVRALVESHRHLVPCVRIGGTDLSAIWSLRRPRDFTIYDVAVVRNAIADFVNVLHRSPDGLTISGVVWEYIRDERIFKPSLRETPFRDALGMEEGSALRSRLVSTAVDGLLRETLLDRANGLHGKTVIHPSHVAPVDAAHVVTYDEWESAQQILDAVASGGGVSATSGSRQMNEANPHEPWARQTVSRADAFGVLGPGHTFLTLLDQELDVA